MKKILSIIILTLCIFQMVVLAIVIEMGSEAIDRAYTYDGGYTIVEQLNPADDTGTITQVEIYANQDLTNVQFAIFSASGNDITSHASTTIGNVNAGYTSHVVSLAVSTGNYIGMYFETGKMVKDYNSNNGGWWYLTGDHIPCTSETFTYDNDHIPSIKGTGTTPTEDDAIFFGFNF